MSIRLLASLGAQADRRASAAELVGLVLLLAALPALFLHARYQPGTELRLGSAFVTVTLADGLVLAVALAAAVAALRGGAAVFRETWPVWVASLVFLAVIAASTVYGSLQDDEYSLPKNLVTAAKFGEYALLAPAAAVLIRGRRQLLAVLGSLVVWGMVATVVGALQFFGVVEQFRGRAPGARAPSLIGVHDFAALSGAALAVTLLAVALRSFRGGERLLPLAAGVAGTVGLVLSAALDAVAGMLAGAVLLAAVAARLSRLTLLRALALAAIAAGVTTATLAFRAADLDQFVRFLGIRPAERQTEQEIQTYAHRTVLVYIGTRIFLDHPVFGVGWQGSSKDFAYGPYLSDARARFPDQPDQVFPSPAHPWGVQNGYVQALADMGVIGLLALLALLGTAFAVCVRPALRAPPEALAARLALAWLLLVASGLAALGLYAGVPLDALLWLAVGLAAVGARRAPEVA